MTEVISIFVLSALDNKEDTATSKEGLEEIIAAHEKDNEVSVIRLGKDMDFNNIVDMIVESDSDAADGYVDSGRTEGTARRISSRDSGKKH